jgi:OmpR-family two-component system manganese-sensing sensor histidine kinase
MESGIVSSSFPKLMFRVLRLQFLLSYLIVMATTLGLFTVAVYLFFARSLYHQLDDELLTLAKAASPSLAIARKEYPKSLNEDISWRDVFRRDQRLEWFDQNRQLLAKEGATFPFTAVGNQLNVVQKSGQIRSVVIPVYGSSQSSKQLTLEGYVRVSQSTQGVEKTLTKLGWGVGLGGIIALTLSSIGGRWLAQKSVKPIERSFNQLKQFTADASHELRSPLTVVKTSIGVMLKHPERVHPQDLKKVKAIASATDQMNRLVEDLLFLARTDAETAARYSPLPLSEVLQEVVDLLEPQFQAKQVTFNCQLLEKTTVLGSTSQLTRLFSNLLENALQYTPAGGTITLLMVQSDRSVVISVQDTGIGMTSEQSPFVFDRFWRADKARFYRDGGMGLGLEIAQSIAQNHGSEITVSSQLGMGSCFQVCLPVV